MPLDVDAGQPGGLGVAADGDGAAAEGGAVEQDPADDRDQAKMQTSTGMPSDVAAEEVDEARAP